MPYGNLGNVDIYAVLKSGEEVPIKELQNVTIEEAEGKLESLGFIRPILCKDCKWYTRPHIKFNDGTKKYFDNEKEMPFVSADIGIIVGGKCIGHKTYCTAHNREDPNDYEELVVFRNTHDYCNYAVRKEGKE